MDHNELLTLLERRFNRDLVRQEGVLWQDVKKAILASKGR